VVKDILFQASSSFNLLNRRNYNLVGRIIKEASRAPTECRPLKHPLKAR
jgi:hypothetical protein